MYLNSFYIKFPDGFVVYASSYYNQTAFYVAAVTFQTLKSVTIQLTKLYYFQDFRIRILRIDFIRNNRAHVRVSAIPAQMKISTAKILVENLFCKYH